MTKEFAYSIVIGRFQPVHTAHQEIFKLALSISDKLIIIIGSHNRAPDIRNPFSSSERRELILGTLTEEERKRVQFIVVRDYLYNENAWFIEVQQKISDLTECSDSICLVGHKSDLTSYYLDSFCSSWKFIDYKPEHSIHATRIRDLYFRHDLNYREHLDPNVVDWMNNFKKTEKFAILKDNFDELNEYIGLWMGAPYDPVFMTVDCVVIKSAHLLVIQRKGKYGKGLLALPGGFVAPEETLKQSAIRELVEETNIKVSREELNRSILTSKVFDDPLRSLRGRTITNAFYLNLGAGLLPKVQGGDDASKSFWMPLSEYYTKEDQFFEDHWHIVYNFISKV